MGGFIMKRNIRKLSFTEGLRLLDKSINSDFQDERETARLLLHLKLQQSFLFLLLLIICIRNANSTTT